MVWISKSFLSEFKIGLDSRKQPFTHTADKLSVSQLS
jgi:hypothetical protein